VSGENFNDFAPDFLCVCSFIHELQSNPDLGKYVQIPSATMLQQLWSSGGMDFRCHWITKSCTWGLARLHE
jgi:hypothetical protein